MENASDTDAFSSTPAESADSAWRTRPRQSYSGSSPGTPDGVWSSRAENAILGSRLRSQDEDTLPISLDHVFSLFISLAADVHTEIMDKDETVLEQVVNRDIGIIDAGTTHIGKGASFQVRALLSESDRIIILKSVLQSSAKQPNREEQARIRDSILELRALSHKPLRNHKNIIKLLGLTWETDWNDLCRKWPVLVLEYADGGTMDGFLQTHPTLEFHQRLSLCRDTAMGLSALHQCGVVHGDLKPSNVLICKSTSSIDGGDWVAKLADFGASVLDVGEDQRGLLSMGSFPWEAPEFNQRLTRNGLLLTDVYSLGLLFWTIMSGGMTPIIHDLDIYGLASYVGGELQVETLRRKERDSFSGLLMAQGRKRFVNGVDQDVVSSLIAQTVQADPSIRNIDTTNSILEGVLLAGGVALGMADRPDLEQITMSSNLENILMANDQADTLSAGVQEFVRRQLEDTFNRHAEPATKSAAAFALSVDALRRTRIPSHKQDCLRWLVTSSRFGNQTAQSLVFRFHDAFETEFGAESYDLFKGWVLSAAQRNFPAAQADLPKIASPEEVAVTMEQFKTRYAGLGWNRYAALYSNGQHRPLAEWDLALRGKTKAQLQRPSFSTADLSLNTDNVFHFAASAGFVATVGLWADPIPISINEKGTGGETALLQACRSGHLDVIRLLLRYGADPKVASSNGDTPLHWLVSFDDSQVEDAARMLVDGGADIDAAAKSVSIAHAPLCNYEAGTALHRAVGRGKFTVVRALVNLGANADDVGHRPDERSPVYLAAQYHYSDILDFLLQSLGVDKPAARSYAGVSLLAVALRGEVLYGERFSRIARHGKEWWSESERTMDTLLARGALDHLHGFPATMRCRGTTPLLIAASMGVAEDVQYLLDRGCSSDLNSLSYYWLDGGNYTPLVKAIFQCRDDVFQVLLDRGADISIKYVDENGHELPYLYQCAAAGHNEVYMASELVSRGVSVRETIPRFESAFACAVRNRCFALAEWLLEQGADPHGEYSKGLMVEAVHARSLLGWLILEHTRGGVTTAKWLLSKVPDTHWIVSQETGSTALHAIAAARNYRRDEWKTGVSELMAGVMLGHFRPSQEMLDQKDNNSRSALWVAVIMANPMMVDALVRAGARTDTANADGVSASQTNEVLLEMLRGNPDAFFDKVDPRPLATQIRSIRTAREAIRESLNSQTDD
ncbi:ankyrin repeat-containing domain protein [Lasiosphaeria hispida]|uniref:Ankyrin repeat-containing domain protein n=1 Tax=Lasiosphaeria hispida TaxID=260671 RepID=A0AAJ0MBL5_9PEZI|nr:ankyrin repeat-containing domain protein [Lasiosphaeria hispida]